MKNVKIYGNLKQRLISFVLAGSIIGSALVLEVKGKSDETFIPTSYAEFLTAKKLETEDKLIDRIIFSKECHQIINLLSKQGIYISLEELKPYLYNYLNVDFVVKEVSKDYLSLDDINYEIERMKRQIKRSQEIDKIINGELTITNIDDKLLDSFYLVLNGNKLGSTTISICFEKDSNTLIEEFNQALEIFSICYINNCKYFKISDYIKDIYARSIISDFEDAIKNFNWSNDESNIGSLMTSDFFEHYVRKIVKLYHESIFKIKEKYGDDSVYISILNKYYDEFVIICNKSNYLTDELDTIISHNDNIGKNIKHIIK